MKTLVSLSGGIDSSTLAYYLSIEKNHEISCVSFRYGQKHKPELTSSKEIAKSLNVEHTIIDLGNIGSFLESALTQNKIDIPCGHWSEPRMGTTFVPNRNAILLAIAFGVARSRNMDAVAYAPHKEDYELYPDTRPDFVSAFNEMEKKALDNNGRPYLLAPFIDISKGEILQIGDRLNVPFELTWTCYNGFEKQCGKCPACSARKEAFRDAGLSDPTEYL